MNSCMKETESFSKPKCKWENKENMATPFLFRYRLFSSLFFFLFPAPFCSVFRCVLASLHEGVSVRMSVRPSVCPYVRMSVTIKKKQPGRILLPAQACFPSFFYGFLDSYSPLFSFPLPLPFPFCVHHFSFFSSVLSPILTFHYGPDQPRIQTKILRLSFVPLIICLHRSLVCSLAYSLKSLWESKWSDGHFCCVIFCARP